MKKLTTLCFIAGLALPASAATITQTAGNSTGASDWNSADYGTPPAAPTAGNAYVTNSGLGGSTDSSFGVNTVSYLRIFDVAGGNTFTGGSLENVSGERLLDKSAPGDGATANLILDDGSLFDEAANAAGTTFLGGSLAISSGTGFATIGVNQNAAATLNINSSLTGSGNLDLAGTGGLGVSTLLLNGNINGFSGTINTLTNGVYGITTTALDTAGTLDLTMGTFDLSNNLEFKALSVGGTNFLSGVYTAATIDALSGTSLVTDTTTLGTGTITVLGAGLPVVPEPSTVCLTGLALLALITWNRRCTKI